MSTKISAERVFPVMGSEAQVLVVGDGAEHLADTAARQLHELEARWSRFIPDSDVSRLNDHPGVPVLVAAETFRLVELALTGWEITGGRFDPTLLGELRAAGYDRSFELLPKRDARDPSPSDATAVTGSEPERPARPIAVPDIHLDHIVGTVRLGAHTTFDPGGIGKGLAADLVVEELLALGARGALVSVGGDLRAAGDAPNSSSWVVAIADPLDGDRTVATLHLEAGAVASSWRTKRAWIGPDGRVRHHLIDPRTGAPAHSGLAGVTVVAGAAWRAEVLAKAAFLAGIDDGAAVVTNAGAAAVLFTDGGRLVRAGDIDAFLAPGADTTRR